MEQTGLKILRRINTENLNLFDYSKRTNTFQKIFNPILLRKKNKVPWSQFIYCDEALNNSIEQFFYGEGGEYFISKAPCTIELSNIFVKIDSSIGCFTINITQTLKIYSRKEFSFPHLATLDVRLHNISERDSSISWPVVVRCEGIACCLRFKVFSVKQGLLQCYQKHR